MCTPELFFFVLMPSLGIKLDLEYLQVDPKDLRLKLICKRISRHIEHRIEEHEKMELHEKVLRAIRSLESSERSIVKDISQTTREAGTPRSSYASWTLDGPSPRFLD